jgi:hypothetical protein
MVTTKNGILAPDGSGGNDYQTIVRCRMAGGAATKGQVVMMLYSALYNEFASTVYSASVTGVDRQFGVAMEDIANGAYGDVCVEGFVEADVEGVNSSGADAGIGAGARLFPNTSGTLTGVHAIGLTLAVTGDYGCAYLPLSTQAVVSGDAETKKMVWFHGLHTVVK